MEIRVKEGMYQDRFLLSESKFPAMIAAVGTGKTLCLLLKVYKYLEQYPESTGLICRREFVDLRDSTMKDFEQYFGVKIGSDKNFRLPNGSMLMFRHAAELNMGNLKNINLAIAAIEQAEEFEEDTVFQFIRDRLRQKNGASVRPLCIIANANGHNWVWKLWISGAECTTIDAATGQHQFVNGEYMAITANSWANANNLPPDFVADLKRKEVEAPKHYRQYVLNSFEEMVDDDYVFTFNELMAAQGRQYAQRTGYGHRIAGYDVARFGDDKCAVCGIQQMGALAWKQFLLDEWEHKDLDYTTGRILATSQTNLIDDNIIDEDGLGGGPLDFITKGRKREDFRGFRNPNVSREIDPFYCNARTAAAFKAKEYISKGWISLTDEGLIQELMTLRYKFSNDGRRVLITKDEMRKKGVKSPNKADAFLMAVSLINEVKEQQDQQYFQQPAESKEESLYGLAGIR